MASQLQVMLWGRGQQQELLPGGPRGYQSREGLGRKHQTSSSPCPSGSFSLLVPILHPQFQPSPTMTQDKLCIKIHQVIEKACPFRFSPHPPKYQTKPRNHPGLTLDSLSFVNISISASKSDLTEWMNNHLERGLRELTSFQ